MVKAWGGLVAGLFLVVVGVSLMLQVPRKPKPRATTRPVALASLPKASCPGLAHLTIVAHQDDDLLFMNPDISRSLQAGECNWTVYVTAGDAGQGAAYWSGREQGAQAAYSAMSGERGPWVRQAVRLSDRHVVMMARPRDNPRLGLVFLRLPDGNTDGSGFAATGQTSLQRILNGPANGKTSLRAVDGSSVYTGPELVTALRQLMAHFAPAEIRSPAAQMAEAPPDHSDHLAVGRLVRQAYDGYRPALPAALKFYLGYEVTALPVNVADADLAAKRAAFVAYARFDRDGCPAVSCPVMPPYSDYLARQYQAER